MHYVGVMAMQMNAKMSYDLSLFILSIVVAVVLAAVSLKMNTLLYNDKKYVVSRVAGPAVVMGLAISGVHYMGMHAMYIIETPETVYVDSVINLLMIKVIIAVLFTLSVIALTTLELRARIIISARLKAVLNTVQDAVISINRKGTIIYVNPATLKIFGFSKDELIDKNVSLLMPDKYADKHANFLAHYFKSGEKKVIGKSRLLEGQRKDGSVFPITLSVSPINQGSKDYFVGTIRDLTNLKNQEAFMYAVFDTLPLMLFVKDGRTLSFTHLNNMGEKIFGLSREEVIGKNDFDFFSEKEARSFVEADKKVLASKQALKIEEEPITINGMTRYLRTEKIVINNPHGKDDFLLGISEDITQLRETERKLENLNQRFSLAADAAHIGVWEWNLTTNELIWDEWMLKLYGISERNFTATYETWANALHPDDAEKAIDDVNQAVENQRSFHSEFRIVLPNGDIRHIQADARIYKDQGSGQRMIGTNRDISQRVLAQNEALMLAQHDHLTGLANRGALVSFVEQEFSRTQRVSQLIGCLFFDLNNFKPINDNCGHQAGDQILVEVAKRLVEVARDSDCVARIGGDEFVVIVTLIEDASQITAAYDRFLSAFTQPITTDKGVFKVGISVGHSIYPTEASTLDELLHLADERMYAHKQANRD